MGSLKKKTNRALLNKGAWAAVAAAFGITIMALGVPSHRQVYTNSDVSGVVRRPLETEIKDALKKMNASSTSALSKNAVAEALKKLTAPSLRKKS